MYRNAANLVIELIYNHLRQPLKCFQGLSNFSLKCNYDKNLQTKFKKMLDRFNDQLE